MRRIAPDNSLEGIHERLARAHHEAQRIGTQRHLDTLRLLRRYADDVFRLVSLGSFGPAEQAYARFRALWEDAPQHAREATYSPAELEKVLRVSRALMRAVAAHRL